MSYNCATRAFSILFCASLDEVGAVGGEEMYKGDLLKERPELRDAKRVGIGASVAAGVAVTAATGGLFGVVAGLAVFGLGTLRSVGVEQRKKNMYQCGGCRKDKFSVVRYRCGLVQFSFGLLTLFRQGITVIDSASNITTNTYFIVFHK